MYFATFLSNLLEADMNFDEMFLFYDFLTRMGREFASFLGEQSIAGLVSFNKFNSLRAVLLINIFDKVEIFVKHGLHVLYYKENIVAPHSPAAHHRVHLELAHADQPHRARPRDHALVQRAGPRGAHLLLLLRDQPLDQLLPLRPH
jgi:hypothetical protein